MSGAPMLVYSQSKSREEPSVVTALITLLSATALITLLSAFVVGRAVKRTVDRCRRGGGTAVENGSKDDDEDDDCGCDRTWAESHSHGTKGRSDARFRDFAGAFAKATDALRRRRSRTTKEDGAVFSSGDAAARTNPIDGNGGGRPKSQTKERSARGIESDSPQCWSDDAANHLSHVRRNQNQNLRVCPTPDCVSSSESDAPQWSDAEYLSNVQRTLNVSDTAFDAMNRREVLRIEQWLRNRFLYQETTRLNNSVAFQKRRDNPRYLWRCIKNAKERMANDAAPVATKPFYPVPTLKNPKPRTAPLSYPLRFTIAITKNQLSAESLSHLHSMVQRTPESKHAFRREKFCWWLWENSVATTADETTSTLQPENLESEWRRCQLLDVPWFEREEEERAVPPSDDVLRHRKSCLQFAAKLVLDENHDGGRLILLPVELRKAPKSNRVLRHFWKHRDRFLVVKVDEELKRTAQGKQMLKNALERGLTLCGRKFCFLYDHDGKVHMFAPLENNQEGPGEMRSKKALINWIGDLSLVAKSKKCDRISMAFTPTSFIASLREDQVKVRDDIISECGNFCFTDGVGRYGLDIQELVVGKHQLLAGCDRVCAMQVRIGSAKGMLVLDPRIQGVMLRKSMIKFRCSRLELEVVEVNCSARVDSDGESKVSQMRLNAELIQLLEYNGVSLDTFHEILNEQLEKLRATLESPSAPLMLKRKFEIGNDIPFMEADQINYALAGGLDMTLFPVRDWVENLLEQEVQKLKELKIPIELGASNLFGVTLENSGLKANQVYVKLSPYEQPLQGQMMIGRHPCNHPGDMRLVEAVDGVTCNQRLGHLHGVVVFSTEGERPIPNMTSGGDLDGDKFFIISDPRLLCSPAPPFDYGSYTPKPYDSSSLGLGSNSIVSGAVSDVECQSLIQEFVQFQDNVGQLTNLRKVAADKFGVNDSRTMKLCELVSRALDAKANDEHVSVPEYLKVTGKPMWWTKTSDYRYSPDTAVGKCASFLFSVADNFEFSLEKIKADPHLEAPIVANGLASHEIEAYEREARDVVEEYFSKKRIIVNEKKKDSIRTKMFHEDFGDKQPDNSADRWDKEFRLLDNEVCRRILTPSRGSDKHGGGYSAEECMRRVTSLYRYCLDNRRKKGQSTSILKIPLVLECLVRIKKDAVWAETVEQGNVPGVSLVLSPPGNFVVVRKKDAKLFGRG